MKFLNIVGSSLFVLLLSGCAPPLPSSIDLIKTPLSQLRIYQTRQFQQSDQTVMLQSVMKALAGLDFQIARIDEHLGLIEAIQLDRDHIMQLNIVIDQLPNRGNSVRMDARFDQLPVEDPAVYQRFFDTLSRNVN